MQEEDVLTLTILGLQVVNLALSYTEVSGNDLSDIWSFPFSLQ